MSYTTVTITDTVRDPSGVPVPYAVVVAWPRQGFANGGTNTNATSVVASAAGAFSLPLNASDDAGTVPIDPALASETPSYHVLAFDPRSGEHLYDGDVQVPHAVTPTTLVALPAY